MIPTVGIDSPLERLLYTGVLEEEVNILGQKVKMKVLNSGEQQDVFEATSSFDPVTRLRAMQLETLARSIIAFNNIPITLKLEEDNENPITPKEMKQKLIEQKLSFLRKASTPLIDELYDEYDKLRLKQENQITELKKKLKKTGQEADGKLGKE